MKHQPKTFIPFFLSTQTTYFQHFYVFSSRYTANLQNWIFRFTECIFHLEGLRSLPQETIILNLALKLPCIKQSLLKCIWSAVTTVTFYSSQLFYEISRTSETFNCIPSSVEAMSADNNTQITKMRFKMSSVNITNKCKLSTYQHISHSKTNNCNHVSCTEPSMVVSLRVYAF